MERNPCVVHAANASLINARNLPPPPPPPPPPPHSPASGPSDGGRLRALPSRPRFFPVAAGPLAAPCPSLPTSPASEVRLSSPLEDGALRFLWRPSGSGSTSPSTSSPVLRFPPSLGVAGTLGWVGAGGCFGAEPERGGALPSKRADAAAAAATAAVSLAAIEALASKDDPAGELADAADMAFVAVAFKNVTGSLDSSFPALPARPCRGPQLGMKPAGGKGAKNDLSRLFASVQCPL